MAGTGDTAYFTARAAKSRSAAAAAKDPAVAAIHLRMAARYDTLANGTAALDPLST